MLNADLYPAQGTRLQSNNSQNKTLFGDNAMGTFHYDNRSSRDELRKGMKAPSHVRNHTSGPSDTTTKDSFTSVQPPPPSQGCTGRGGTPLLLHGAQRMPSHCPLTASAGFNGICNRR